MARPTKNGLDYFPLDTEESDEIVLLEAETGLQGHMIFIKLLKAIYSDGYYIEWSEMRQKLFSHRVNVDINTISRVVNVCISVGLFNGDLYEKYGILTSRGIQKRFFTAINKRKRVFVCKNYMLVDINDYINPVKHELMYTESTQSKVNLKVKETRVNNTSTPSAAAEPQSGKDDDEPTEESREVAKADEPLPAIHECEDEATLYKAVQKRFLDQQLEGRFKNWGKEGKAIKELIKEAKARSPDDPALFLDGMIRQFERLREEDEYYRKHPFIPSRLNSAGIFENVLTEAKNRWEEERKRESLRIDDEEIVF